MFKSSLLFVTFLLTILIISNNFFEISAQSCGNKCKKGEKCCFLHPQVAFIDDHSICCKNGCSSSVGCK
uniref:Candidate secreted effector n=1 Tax=Meloidogyne incognita TaxID=6306 RepID=A0A914MF42_MELIC